MPRPHACTPEVVATIARAIDADHWMSLEQCCAIAGITARTFYNWRRRAENGDEEFQELLKPFFKANAEAQGRFVEELRATGDPRAMLHVLQARFPEMRFAQQVDVGKALPEVMDVLEEMLPPELAEKIIARLGGEDDHEGVAVATKVLSERTE